MQQWQDELDEDDGHPDSNNSSEGDEESIDFDDVDFIQSNTAEDVLDARQAAIETSMAPKRKRGRPPKQKPKTHNHSDTIRHELGLINGRASQDNQVERSNSEGGDNGRALRAPKSAVHVKKEIPELNSTKEGVNGGQKKESSLGEHDIEEIVVDDLLLLVCRLDQKAEFVRCLAEPTFLYAPKKAASRSTGSRSKRQSVRSPT